MIYQLSYRGQIFSAPCFECRHTILIHIHIEYLLAIYSNGIQNKLEIVDQWFTGIQVIAIHYNDVVMGAMASQITSPAIVYSTVYSGADQRKHESSSSLAVVRRIHRWPVSCQRLGWINLKIGWRVSLEEDCHLRKSPGALSHRRGLISSVWYRLI